MKKMLLPLVLLFLFQATSLLAQKAAIVNTDSIRANLPKKKKKEYPFSMNSRMDIDQNLDSSKQYHQFYTLIATAGLRQTFGSTGPLTVFMVDETALSLIPKARLDTLMRPSHHFELVNILTYHALRGRFKIKNIAKKIKQSKGKATFTSISGGKIIASFDPNGDIVLTDEKGGKSTLSKLDITAANGILHPISALMIPRNKDF